MDVNGKRVLICHVGSIGKAIWARFEDAGATLGEFVHGDSIPHGEVDIAICTSGRMLIQHPQTVWESAVAEMLHLNYIIPRVFTEYMLAAGEKLVIHIGSNSARYGKSYAEDYAAAKSALAKYCEIRGALASKENGARITYINLGGVNNVFWDHVCGAPGFDSDVAANLIPAEGKGLTNAEVAELVLAICLLPENVCVKDLLVVAKAYQ